MQHKQQLTFRICLLKHHRTPKYPAGRNRSTRPRTNNHSIRAVPSETFSMNGDGVPSATGCGSGGKVAGVGAGTNTTSSPPSRKEVTNAVIPAKPLKAVRTLSIILTVNLQLPNTADAESGRCRAKAEGRRKAGSQMKQESRKQATSNRQSYCDLFLLTVVAIGRHYSAELKMGQLLCHPCLLSENKVMLDPERDDTALRSPS